MSRYNLVYVSYQCQPVPSRTAGASDSRRDEDSRDQEFLAVPIRRSIDGKGYKSVMIDNTPRSRCTRFDSKSSKLCKVMLWVTAALFGPARLNLASS